MARHPASRITSRITSRVAAWAATCSAAALLAACTERPAPEAGRYVAVGAAGPAVSTNCLGPGQPETRGIWPGQDATRHRFLPPGCASSTAIAAMVVEPGDLLRGQPLAPGAALPVARAIERYYNRGEDTATPAAPPAAAPPPVAPSPATPAPAVGGNAGLLQGPLGAATATAPAP